MSDIDGLKQRISLVDLRLQTAHSARERESASLIEMWEEMRDRYAEQQETVAELRQRVSELESTRDELTALVLGLLEAVESGIERMSDDTIPDIREMAGTLIGHEAHAPSAESEEEARDHDFELVLDEALEELPENDGGVAVPLNNEGIRDLIRRVELAAKNQTAIADTGAPLDTSPPPESDDDELISLRTELEKLRQQSLAATG